MEGLIAVFRSYLLFIVIQTLEAQPSFILKPVSPQNVSEGDNVTLSWSYNLNGTFQDASFQIRKVPPQGPVIVIITKYPNNNPTTTDVFKDRFHLQKISGNQTSVIITGIPRSDSGKYRYQITNGNFQTDSTDVEISVLYQPGFTTFFAGNQTLNENDSLTLICAADGNPKPSITWTRVSDNTHVYSPLVINGKQDEGEYRCTASNGVGNSDSRTVYIFVQNYRPIETTVTTNLISNIVVVDTVFSITCSAQANPAARYRFYKGKENISGKGNNAVITTSVKERVKQVNYSCIPFNQYGNGTASMVTVTVHFGPTMTNLTITSYPRNTTVLINSGLTLHCATNANPSALLYLYFNEKYISNSSSGDFHITVESDGFYTCVPINPVGRGNNATLSFTVVEPSEILKVKVEQDFCVGSEGGLSCTATGKPPPKITWTRVWNNDTDSEELYGERNYVVPNVSRTSNGSYRCTAFNGVGDPVNQTVEAIVSYPASVIRVVNSSNTVTEGNNFSLSCEVRGDPSPTVEWIKVGIGLRSQDKVLNFTNITRHDYGDYRCEATNKCGTKTMTTAVNVHYEPVKDGTTKFKVVENKEFSLRCPITGNPTPEYNWFKNNLSEKTRRGRTWVFQQVESSDSGSYTCSAKNYLGVKTVIVSLHVVTVVKIVYLEFAIKEEENNATERNRTCKTASNDACRLSKDCVDNEVLSCRNSSIVVEFQLKFSRNVTASEVISDLKEAVAQGEFGSLAVVASSIKQIYPLSSTTEPTSKVAPSTKVPECPESFVKKESCKLKYLNISVVIILVLGVIVVVIVITYCVHKKRKCRKNTRVKNSDGLPLNHRTLSDSNLCANDNGGYHKSGPQPTVEIANEQSLGAAGGEQIPTYAMVDKSKKKDKKENKEAAEQKLTEDQYAVVDKSKKKKKKSEQDNTYAEVDMSKKSKKKQKQGEVLYADLDQFHQMQKMPKAFTSPKLLPPIKMPETYGETQYADITQFLKGNLDDAGAELPKDSSTPAVGNTATGSKVVKC